MGQWHAALVEPPVLAVAATSSPLACDVPHPICCCLKRRKKIESQTKIEHYFSSSNSPIPGSSKGSNSPSAHESLFQLALCIELFKCDEGGLMLLQLVNAPGVVGDVVALLDRLASSLGRSVAVCCCSCCCRDGDVVTCELSFANGSIRSFSSCCCSCC